MAEGTRESASAGHRTRLPDGARLARLRQLLCGWFDANQRDLPWRRTRDPYAIWISEAMLQQTRVETVIPYYERFLARFPTVAELARSAEADVLAAWSGLGYYRRARSLRAAAERLLAEHGGRFPATRRELLALPGIGPYTAGALLSIAFQRAEPLVDGNVARVLCRLFLVELDPKTTSGSRELWRIAARLVPPAPEVAARAGRVTPGSWNQALMELGAVLCTPRSPGCGACPLRSRCRAARSGRTEELPRLAPRRAAVEVRLEILLIQQAAERLLVRRPAEGRMADMWELPTRELAGDGGPARLWPERHALPGTVARVDQALGSVRHSITHHRILAHVLRGRLAQPPPQGPRVRWAADEDLGGLELTGLTRKILTRWPA